MEEERKTLELNIEDNAGGQDERPGGVTDDTIEYTLLVHEIPELLKEQEALEAAQNAAPELIPAEAVSAEETEQEAETEAEPAGVSDETIEYTLLAHEIPTLIREGYVPKGPESEKAEPEKTGEEAKDPGGETESEAESDGQTGDAVSDGERKTKYGLPVDRPETKDLAYKMEARRRYKERKRRSFRTRFYVGITCIVLLITFAILSVSGIFTVDSIEVRGNTHYSAEEIINMGHAVPGRNLIYHANKEEITGYLEQNPYIKTAKVSRKLPSTLVISVTERTERLAFGYDDDYLIMDEDGILLKKTRNKPKITLVEGLVVSRIKLGEKIGTEDNERFNKVLELVQKTAKADLYFVKIDISSEKRIKAYIYDTLVVRTDYDTLIANIENGRLHLVLENLFADGIERGTITFDEDGTASFQPTI